MSPARLLSSENDAIMEPKGRGGPEFEIVGFHPETGPEFRPRNRATQKLSFVFSHSSQEAGPAIERSTLFRGPGA